VALFSKLNVAEQLKSQDYAMLDSAVYTKFSAFIFRLWKEGKDYCLQLFDANGNVWSGKFFFNSEKSIASLRLKRGSLKPLLDLLDLRDAKSIEKLVIKLQTALSLLKQQKTSEVSVEQQRDDEEFDEETRKKAMGLLRDPAFFYKLGKLFEKGFIVRQIGKPRFVIKEERNKRLIPILLLGAAKKQRGIIYIHGEPGTSKDTIVMMSLELLGLKYEKRGYLTTGAFRYSEQLKDADVLYFPDAERLSDEKSRQLRFMRTDDGGFRAEYAYRDPRTGKFVTETVDIPAKAIVITTNEISRDIALESGMWMLVTSSDEELTKEVKKEKLKLRAGKRKLVSEDELRVWRCAFKILREMEWCDVKIPYAQELMVLFEKHKTPDSRRDPDKICDLIETIANIRRFQKPENMKNVADLTDLYVALQLGWNVIMKVKVGLTENEIKVLKAVQKKGVVRVCDVADETKLSYTRSFEILEKLVEKGYLNKGQEGRYNVYSPLIGIDLDDVSNLSTTFAENTKTVVGIFKKIVASLRNFRTFDHINNCIRVCDPVTGDELKIEVGENKESKIVGDSKLDSATQQLIKSVEEGVKKQVEQLEAFLGGGRR